MSGAWKRLACVLASAVAIHACSDGRNETPTSPTTPPPPSGALPATTTTTLPNAPTTTTTLPITNSVSGRWVGELIVTQNANCNEENDLTVELTQDGASVRGGGMLVTRRPANCGGNALSIVGTVGIGTVDLTASGQRDGFPFALRLTGSVSGSRMAGSFQCVAACNQSGTWTLSR
jgi:hypothetical protein